MIYTDKLGNEVKEGSILWYNESISYAESIHKVIDVDGVLYGITVIGNYNGKYFVNKQNDAVEIRHYTNDIMGDKSGVMLDALVIGNIEENPEMLTVEFANKYYPLNKQP